MPLRKLTWLAGLGQPDGRRDAGMTSAQLRLPLEQPKAFPKRYNEINGL